MKNYLKKFSIMFVMSLILVFGYCSSVFATDTYTDNLIPTMTSNTDPSGVVSSNGTYNSSWKDYYAFNNNNTSGWIGNTANSGWIQYKFPIEKQITKYTISNLDSGSYVRYPRSFSLKASNTGLFSGEEVTLDTQTNLVFANGEKKTFICSNPPTNSYLYYRIVVTNSGGYAPCIGDIEMMENIQNNTASISLDKSSMDLTEGTSDQLIATTTPAGAEVVWSSSDTNIASVDSSGKVTAVGQGTCSITATMNDGSNLSATCIVTVTNTGGGTTEPTDPEEPVGDGSLFIELVDGNIKNYDVSSTEITNFINWYKNRDLDSSESPIYKFTKGSYKDYVVHDKIVWFEIR